MRIRCAALLLASACHATPPAPSPQRGASLVGTWDLVAADKELPDGTRVPDYGAHPVGRLMIDAQGRYSLQIFRSERPNFAANDRAKGTDSEMREAVLGVSTAIGTVTTDWEAHTMQFNVIDGAYPNIRGTSQVRPFTFDGKVLAWRVAKRPDGSVPISVWRRAE